MNLLPYQTLINDYIGSWITKSIPNNLQKSMSYSLEAGGKRIRPVLTMCFLEAFNEDKELGLDICLATEMVHTYSLIHDDLPSLDNDSLRRGNPTNHIIFGEGLALLAGDALLTDSFRIISNAKFDDDIKVRLISEFSKLIGSFGMIKGQVLDIESEQKIISLKELKEIHLCKTAALIQFSVISAGIITRQSEETINKLREFSNLIGLAFQIKDDILDVTADTETLGKNANSDLELDKSTYVKLLGLESAQLELVNTINSAIQILVDLKLDSDILISICHYIKDRQK